VDTANDPLSKLGDFHYTGVKQATDYSYDGNGNLVSDNNKTIDSIIYNYLNLPQKVHIKGKGNILYTYDATGNKMTKVTMDSLSGHATTTLYLNGFIYQQQDTITNPTGGIDTLQFLMHEEGKFRWALHYYQNGSRKYGWENDLFEKDHLGNTRIILTTQKDTGFYAATMEAANRAKENALFYNIPQTSYSRVLAGYPVDTSMTNPNDSVIMVNGTAGRTQGPAIILKVMGGDTVSIGVKSYYTSQSGTGTNPSITDVLTSLANGVVGATSGGKGTFSQLDNTSSPLYGALNSFIGNKDTTIPTKPRAYLNWIFLDDQYKYDSLNSGASAVGNMTAGVLNTLAKSNMVVAKNGFLYVWVSNETQGWPVYFDNLNIQVRTGPVLEETHYYPGGLVMQGISDRALKSNYAENKFKFCGKELQNKEFADGTGFEEYDYGARMYDQQLVLWHNIDPKADQMRRFSPYNYAFDNPVRFIDPDGMGPTDVTILIAKDGAGGYGHMASVIQDGKGNYYYVTMGDAGGAGSSKMASSGDQGGMSVTPLTGAKSMDEAVSMAKQDKNNSAYTDQVTFKTDSKTDQKIYDATVEKADKVNSGEEKYNVLTNNCADGCEKPITKATGVSLPNNVIPNTNFKNLKKEQGTIQTNLDLSDGRAVVKSIPSGIDGIPPQKIIVQVPQKDNKNTQTNQ
jgi:RHS repeat-associated protein